MKVEYYRNEVKNKQTLYSYVWMSVIRRSRPSQRNGSLTDRCIVLFPSSYELLCFLCRSRTVERRRRLDFDDSSLLFWKILVSSHPGTTPLTWIPLLVGSTFVVTAALFAVFIFNE